MVQYGYYDKYAGDEVGQEDQHVLIGGIENEDVNYGQDEPRNRGEHCCFVAVFLAVCPPTLAGIFSRQECVMSTPSKTLWLDIVVTPDYVVCMFLFKEAYFVHPNPRGDKHEDDQQVVDARHDDICRVCFSYLVPGVPSHGVVKTCQILTARGRYITQNFQILCEQLLQGECINLRND